MDNMIDIDFTIVIQMVNLLITLIVLNFILIRPVRKHIASRNALMLDQAQTIENFTQDAATRLADYENALTEARHKATAERESLKEEGVTREQAILASAQSDAQRYLAASREETAKESKEALQSLLLQVDSFAAKAVAKILG